MKKLFLSITLISVVSLTAVAIAAEHDTSDTASGTRTTNNFADYDTLMTKFKEWADKIGDGKREEKVDTVKNKFVVQLTKEQSVDAAKLLERIKWYRNEIVSCESADASSKVLGTVLDECIAPGILSSAIKSAVEKDKRQEISVSSEDLISCQLKIADYYKEKLDTKKGLSSDKFVIDREISEKLSSFFKLFMPDKTELKLRGTVSPDLLDSLAKVAIENRCEVGAIKKPIGEIAAVEQVLPKSPPATQVVQNPPTSLVQKQPEVAAQQQQGGYQAPQGGYQAPQGGYQAPVGGYKAPLGGYNPQNYNYDNEGGYGGLNPAAMYMMMQPKYNGDGGRNYSHPHQFQPYYPPQRNGNGVDVGVSTGNRYPYPQQQYQQPPFNPYMFMTPSVPPPAFVAVGGSSCVSCGSGGSSYVPPPVIPAPLPSGPCLLGMCQPLPCLSAQCMNRPQPFPTIPNACVPLNQGYVGLGVGNLNCIPNNGIPGIPNIGRPPVIGNPGTPGFPGYPPITNFPQQPGIPYNPNLTPGYQQQYQSIPVTPTTYRIPRGVTRRR